MLELVEFGDDIRIGIGPNEADRLFVVFNIDTELGLDSAAAVTRGGPVEIGLDGAGDLPGSDINVFGKERQGKNCSSQNWIKFHIHDSDSFLLNIR